MYPLRDQWRVKYCPHSFFNFVSNFNFLDIMPGKRPVYSDQVAVALYSYPVVNC